MTRNELDPSIQGEEKPTQKESLVLLVSCVTISGRAGTGKTRLATGLVELFDIPLERDFKTGQTIRKSKKGLDRPLEVDIQIDQNQRDIITKKATQDSPYIVEGRLAGVIASEERAKNPKLQAISILLVASTKERMQRIQKRIIGEINKDLNEGRITGKEAFARKAANTLKLIHIREKTREDSDLTRWRQIHPQLEGIDPFNPSNKDRNGRKIYNVIVNNTNLSVDQTNQAVVKALVDLGFAKRVKENPLPSSGVVYKTN